MKTIEFLFEVVKKTRLLVLAVCAVFFIVACDDTETYAEKKEEEREAIKKFISNEGINVISQSTFEAQDETTNVDKNEFVYLDKSGVYMQIERKGAGEMIEENKQVNLLCRYTEYNILEETMQTRNDYSPRTYDKMCVTRVGTTFSATFASGVMYENYGSSVPAGWLVPLLYINVGRQIDEQAEIAKVRLIVPHSQGHSYASASVYPCFYTITYQRER